MIPKYKGGPHILTFLYHLWLIIVLLHEQWTLQATSRCLSLMPLHSCNMPVIPEALFYIKKKMRYCNTCAPIMEDEEYHVDFLRGKKKAALN